MTCFEHELSRSSIACPASLYPICVRLRSEARQTLGRLTGQSRSSMLIKLNLKHGFGDTNSKISQLSKYTYFQTCRRRSHRSWTPRRMSPMVMSSWGCTTIFTYTYILLYFHNHRSCNKLWGWSTVQKLYIQFRQTNSKLARPAPWLAALLSRT